MLNSNLIKREGPCFSRSRSRTQVDSDCEPMVFSGGCAVSRTQKRKNAKTQKRKNAKTQNAKRKTQNTKHKTQNEEEDLPVSMLVTPVTQPASLVPTWVIPQRTQGSRRGCVRFERWTAKMTPRLNPILISLHFLDDQDVRVFHARSRYISLYARTTYCILHHFCPSTFSRV